MSFFRDLRVAFHSLGRAKGLSAIVILTLALGIGANSAIFTLVRGVLLKPLVNRGENRLIYIRQSAPGMRADNTAFSVPEIKDIEGSVHSVSEFGDFSAMDFTMIGLGEPRSVTGGVVSGNYFDVMGLRPVLGRLVGPQDDGPNAAGVIVLTYRFWTTALAKDPSVIGKTVRLGSIGDRIGTVIGVLEPSVPYPQDTEIIANLVMSPHHLSATMVAGRVHRMTELFGRLAPGATLDQARSELHTSYASMTKDHPDAYPAEGQYTISARMLRDQITSGARTVLLVLLAASGLVFIIACSNVANLILARTVRREGELALRAALGATSGALRRMLLAESLLLCSAGAALGVLIAQPLVSILARYASRFSVRALDLTVDSSMLWVGAALAVIAAVILAFVPRLPSADASNGLNIMSGGVRITSSTNRRQRIFAITQIAASFVLLAGSCALVATLLALQAVRSGVDTRQVLALDVPAMSYGKSDQQVVDFVSVIGAILDDCGYSHRDADAWAIPLRAAGAQLVQDLHPHDRGPKGTHEGAVICNGNLCCPGTANAAGARAPSPVPPPASRTRTSTARQPSWPGTSSAASPATTRRLPPGQCPAAMRKVRCPLRLASMALDQNRPEILHPAARPPGVLHPAHHHRPAGRARQNRAEARLRVRGLAALLRPAHRRRAPLRHRQGPRQQPHHPRLVPPHGPDAPHAVHRHAADRPQPADPAAWNARQEDDAPSRQRPAPQNPAPPENPRHAHRRRRPPKTRRHAGTPPRQRHPRRRQHARNPPPASRKQPREQEPHTTRQKPPARAGMSDPNVKIGLTET